MQRTGIGYNTLFKNLKIPKVVALEILEFWMQNVDSKFIKYYFKLRKIRLWFRKLGQMGIIRKI